MSRAAGLAGEGVIFYDRLADTPIDHLWVAAADCGLVAISFRGEEAGFVRYVNKLTELPAESSPAHLAPYHAALQAYFAGQAGLDHLPICWGVMTDFQQRVLRLVWQIPLGGVRTYSDLAHELGNPRAIRAVGRANATNPIPLVVPCHRVIGADGSLRGFGGGLETKAWLLRHEGSVLL